MYTKGRPYRRKDGIPHGFDAIVIGSGMGGLGVASVLAQQGMRMLVLEQNAVIGGLTQSYDRAGYRWTVGMHYIGDVASPRTLTWKMFDYAARGGIRWAHLPPIYNRMNIAGREYRIPAGVEAYRAALHGWFPQEHAAIDRYLELLAAASKSSAPFFALKAYPADRPMPALEAMTGPFHDFARRTTREVIADLTSDPELTAVLCANWGDYGIEPARSSFAMHAMLAKHYMNGASYPHGGGRAFADAIVPVIEAAGGLVLHGAEVAHILVEDGRATGVVMASGEEVRAGVVISGAGLRNTFGRLMAPEARAAAGLDRMRESVTYTNTVVGLHIGLEGDAATLGLEPANIWAHPGTDFDANLAAHRVDFDAPFPFHFITFASAKDPTWNETFPNRSTIEMHALTDYRHFAPWQGTRWMKRGADYEAMKAKVQERLLADLYRLVPATRGAVRYVEVSTPLTYETFVRQQYGDFLGIESSPQRYEQDWLRAQTPVPGLYLTGQDVTSDGIIGALFGGVLCASAVTGRDMVDEIKKAPVFAQDAS
ncbi:phytoene desaturase family protein [Tistrella mobilis]|uniref:Phytoene dehydrogenase and related protein n=1 Tax=Tistrella mobilis (strain KA081020-065) TaxID=1110502 RepID=I3TUH2_TISMK|nr:NAD(P)/FAD-dependent oxidoreductase [Tistrella mobilis]AFK56410.1 Phytoene dehydrogenase and related protein [Tistrella mobilis KA081020-065]